MPESSLTDAVLQAVATADSLVRVYGNWTGDDLSPSHFRDTFANLDQFLRDSSELVERAEEFILLCPTSPEPVAGVSGASCHEMGRNLAFAVFHGVVTAASFSRVKRGKPFFDWDASVDLDSIVDEWPAVREYLRYEAPRFNFAHLVDEIRREAARARVREKPQKQAGRSGGRKATVAARMMDLIKDPDTHGWTAEQFRVKLNCRSRSTITATAAWQQLVISRESARLQRGEDAYEKGLGRKPDRRRRSKRKERPHSLGD